MRGEERREEKRRGGEERRRGEKRGGEKRQSGQTNQIGVEAKHSCSPSSVKKKRDKNKTREVRNKRDKGEEKSECVEEDRTQNKLNSNQQNVEN